MTKGAHLLLNPGSDYGKEFLPSEVIEILDGTIFQPQRHIVERGNASADRQPAEYPLKLVEALQSLYAKLSKVRAAYLAQYFDPSRDKTAGLLVALDATGDWDRIVSDSGICARGLTPDHDHIDFVQLQQSGLQGHFSWIKPFCINLFATPFLKPGWAEARMLPDGPGRRLPGKPVVPPSIPSRTRG